MKSISFLNEVYEERHPSLYAELMILNKTLPKFPDKSGTLESKYNNMCPLNYFTG